MNLSDRSATEQTVHDLVWEHVGAEHPRHLRDVEDLFPLVYGLVTERVADGEPVAELQPGEGLPFAAEERGFHLGPAVWTTFHMVRRLGDAASSPSRAAEVLDRLEPELVEQTGDRSLVRSIRHRVLAEVEAVAADADDSLPPVEPRTPSGDRQPDLRLLVLCRDDGLEILDGHGAAELIFGDMKASFDRPQREWITHRLDRARDLPRTTPDPGVLDRRLRNLGGELAEGLLPAELRELLVDHRRAIRTLQVLSDEPWVPWELLALDAGGGAPRFLCELFCVTRWRRDVAPILDLPLRRIALVAPRDSGLDAAAGEVEAIVSLAGDDRALRLPARQREILDALEADRFDGWHFAGHAQVSGDDPGRWRLVLEEGTDLAPIDLRGKLRPLRPLFFLNGCSAGRGDLSLTGLAGFADNLLTAGAGAVIGPLWEVRDEPAATFARAFYRRFLGGTSLGEAMASARAEMREAFPADPAWLAYAAYGHPAAAVAQVEAAG